MNKPHTPTYHAERGNTKECKSAVVTLWSGNLGDGVDLGQKYDWIYGEKIHQPGTLFLLYVNEEPSPVGAYGLIAREFIVDGKCMKGAVLSDLVVDQRHRTLFPAMVLQKYALEYGAKEFDFIYGFPNANAIPIFRRLGYSPFGRMRRYVHVIDSSDYLQQRIPVMLSFLIAPFINLALRIRFGWHSRTTYTCSMIDWDSNEPANWSWQSFSPKHSHGVRNWDFLQHRFARNPRGGCKLLSLKSNSEKVDGYAVIREDQGAIIVEDLGVVESDLTRVLRSIVRFARFRGAKTIQVELRESADIAKTLARNGFFPRGSREVFAFVQQKVDDEKEIIQKDSWMLTAADEDQ